MDFLKLNKDTLYLFYMLVGNSGFTLEYDALRPLSPVFDVPDNLRTAICKLKPLLIAYGFRVKNIRRVGYICINMIQRESE